MATRLSPLRLVSDHVRSISDPRTGRLDLSDLAILYVVPLLIGAACGWPLGLKIPTTAGAGVVTVAGLLSAFLFQAMLQVADRAMTWADENPLPGPKTTEHADLLKQAGANTGYAGYMSIVTAGVFVAVTVTTGTAQVVTSAVGVACAIHLALVLTMVMNTTYALIQQRLRIAHTGANVQELRRRRTG